jgi:predicted RNase H-like nuclease
LSGEHLVAVGVDGCRGGWVAALCFELRGQSPRTELKRFGSAGDLVSWREQHADRPVVAIDVPIGLLTRVGYRPCDGQARELLGPRWSCVFQAPDRSLFGLSFSEVQAEIARRRQTEPEARGLSKQGHAIMPKIRELDELMRESDDRGEWLVEVHPEVSFRRLAGEDMPPKQRAAGRQARLAALQSCFPDVAERYEEKRWPRREVGRDDILDAYAGLWSARRFAGQPAEHEQLGGGERDDEGVLMRMVV